MADGRGEARVVPEQKGMRRWGGEIQVTRGLEALVRNLDLKHDLIFFFNLPFVEGILDRVNNSSQIAFRS